MTPSRPAVLACVLVAACGGSGGDGPGGGGSAGYDYDTEAARTWTAMCAVCHGEVGEGGIGPTLLDTARSADELRQAIDQRMPAGDPSRCTGDCAAELADFIRSGLTSDALSCPEVTPAPRQVRLLNRREYRNTVRDLFGSGSGSGDSCASATACDYRESCAGGTCQASACDGHTFVFDPGATTYGAVFVAGSFNDWAASDPAWSLTRGGDGLWTGTFTVGEGTFQYKLVADGTWLVDARAPARTPDGFGGENAQLTLSCAGGGVAATDPAAGLPVETRPEGYFFDNNAAAGLVTPVHIDAYLEAAAEVAAAVDLGSVGCGGAADACASALVDSLAPRVFRRPLTEAERERYRALVTGAADAATGARSALQAMLVSPGFLYRTELGEATGDGRFRLTPHEVAAALSYTFWGTMPDAALTAAADDGSLADGAEVERQARRLLADPRSREMVGVFAEQWLGAEAIASVDKSAGAFPDFGPDLRAAMREETRRFVAHVVFDGSGRFDELVTADYTIADARLAAHYDLEGPGSGFAPVAYRHGRRAGVLGHGSLLSVYAHSDQTSPIRRGLMVRRRLLCQDLPPPPPNAGGVPEVDPDATTRERFAQHTNDPFCRGCHQYIDGLGFGFERFDPVGRYRETENGAAIDASGEVTDLERMGAGTRVEYQTVPELAATIADSNAARSCFSRQYYRFARGMRESLAERCARQWIERRFADADFDVRELMIATVLAPDFLVRR